MAGSAPDNDSEMITAINVTPLVDVMLVLLIIFMLTANLIDNPAIKVDLPEASTGEVNEPSTVGLTLTEDGTIYLNGSPTDEEGLRAFIPNVLKDDPKTQAIISAAQSASHGQVIRLIDLIRQLGLFRFALNINPEAALTLPTPEEAPTE
jgi:biopolymer transport protein ExbD